MQDFEKLGLFYLGRRYDMASGKALDEAVLYDSRDLVTHAVCVGMTGSGKTGLCLSLIEEAEFLEVLHRGMVAVVRLLRQAPPSRTTQSSRGTDRIGYFWRRATTWRA